MKILKILGLFLLFVWVAVTTAVTVQVGLETAQENNIDIPFLDLAAGATTEQAQFSYDLGRLLTFAEENGYKVTMGEVWRTMYQQRHNIAKGVSWTYNSKHLKRRAVDLNLIVHGRLAQRCDQYRPLGEYWESLSPKNRWGGRWRHKDCPHFERR